MTAILSTTTFAAVQPAVIINSTNQLGRDLRYAILTTPVLASIYNFDLWETPVFGFFFGTDKTDPKKQERIARIEISPNGATIREGEQINFTAVGYDARGNMIQGLKFNWTARTKNEKSPVLSLPNGKFEPQFYGDFTVFAEIGGMTSNVIIKVKRDDVAVYGKELRSRKLEAEQGRPAGNGTLRPTKINKNLALPAPIETSSKTDSIESARQKNAVAREQKRSLPQPDGKEVVGLRVNCSPDHPMYPDCGYIEANDSKKVSAIRSDENDVTPTTTNAEAEAAKAQDDRTEQNGESDNIESDKVKSDEPTVTGKVVFRNTRYSKDQKTSAKVNNSKNNPPKAASEITVDLKKQVDSICPAGYTSLGVAMLGNPSAVVFGSRLLAFIRGTDNAVYWKYSDDGFTFSNWSTLGGGTYNDPRTIVSGGVLYLEVTGTDSNNYYQSSTNGGTTWSGWTAGTVSAQTSATVTYLGNTYNFVAGTGSQIPLCVQSSGGNGCNNSGYDPAYSWNNLNYPTADDPTQQPGSPSNNGSNGPGSGNHSFSAPVVALSGRGDLNVNLALNYNSLLWHKANSEIYYDIDKSFPAPGWNIGFGKMMDMGSGGGTMLEDPSGTRHSYDGALQNFYGGYSSYTARTNDGSFIDYYSYRTPLGISYGIANLSNGTTIIYGAASDGVAYPTQIKDRHGNFLNISYCNNVGPKINNITDDLGRTIQFNYDNASRLIAITGPGFNGTSEVLVKLHYKSFNLTGTFSGLTPKVRNSNPDVIDAIIYPATNTGYWFGDEGSNPSYSPYGMISKVSERRDMGWSGTTGTQGTITAGLMTREQVYNYPTTALALTEAPKYTTMTEDWAGRETDNPIGTAITPTATTQYYIDSDPAAPTPRTTTVTLPNGNRIIQYSRNVPNALDDGVLYKVETLAPAPSTQILSSSETDWASGDYNAMRVTEIRATDEKGQTTKQTFTYDGVFNQVATVSEYGYGPGFPLLRKSVNTYENSSNYLGTYYSGRWSYGRHIFSLIKTAEVYDAANVRLSKVDYNYDESTLLNTPSVVMYDDTYNPYTTQTTQGDCTYWNFIDYGNDMGGYWECLEYAQVQNFNQSSLFRGNLTSTKTYPVATNPTAPSALTYVSTFDITGNTRTATTDCCELMSFTYTDNTQYSQPEIHTKGDSTDPTLQNTESALYDFNTGLLKIATDFNGLKTNYYYDAAHRLVQTTFPYVTTPNQGNSFINYDDADLKVTQFVKDAANNVVSQSTTYGNGRGQTIRSESLAGSQTNAVAVKYNNLGQRKFVSMPYSTAPAHWTTYNYDLLSRVTQVIAPDGSTSEMVYNSGTKPSSAASDVGNTVKSIDAWGRERWARTDDFGRLVEVVEPDPNGNGSVTAANNMVTSYIYNALDQLVQVTQGDQLRKFAYDSVGRLVRQKLAEQANTIEGEWSDAFVYDNRSNLVERTDARGVKTTFNYAGDPLNRLQSISYDKTSAPNAANIANAGTVTLGYTTGGDKTRVASITTASTTNLSSVTTPAVTETNTYDALNRVEYYNLAITGRASLVTTYSYDTVNRLTSVTYPDAHGTALAPKVITPGYDNASRLAQLNVNGQVQLSDIVYNPMSQVTQLKTGVATGNADIEDYTYDSQTGLLINQKVTKQSSQPLLDLSYDYQRGNSKGTLNGKTGQLTKITNNLDQNKNRIYEFDTLARLITAKGGAAAGGVQTNGTLPAVTANWTQNYSYDRYGNKTGVGITSGSVTANNQPVPVDGINGLTYNTATNRITNSNYEYDEAGNQTRGQIPDGTFQRFDYDAAGRLVRVKADNGTLLESYVYGSSRQRLITENANDRTYYAWGGSSVLCEYKEALAATNFTFAKSYIYAGSRLLSTQTWNGTAETTEFHHPDRLGTKLVTNNANSTHYEQSTLPFGTSLDAEFVGTPTTNQKFTSYDRSGVANLDYAVNRSYSSGQGRFTTVDPIGMSATRLTNPQSLNLYAYGLNSPTHMIDPSGLCTINININISMLAATDIGLGVGLDAVQNELKRIYGGIPGVTITFNQGKSADMNINANVDVFLPPDVAASSISSGDEPGSAFGWTDRGTRTSDIATSHFGGRVDYSSGTPVMTVLSDPTPLNAISLARVIAHEIAHSIFDYRDPNKDSRAVGTILSNPGTNESLTSTSQRWQNKWKLSQKERTRLLERCKPANQPNTTSSGGIGGGGNGVENPGFRLYDNGWSNLDWLWFWYQNQPKQDTPPLIA